MVGPVRPQFVLFGSSIVQYSYSDEGWGAILAHLYARQADIFLRGYAGWNSRQGLQVLDEVFPKDAPIQPSLVIVYFGGNDSTSPHPSGLGPHVPLEEYKENMKKIANHLRSLSKNIRIIFLSAPPVNEEQIRENSLLGTNNSRTNENARIYSEALLEVAREINVKAVDLWSAIQKREDWLHVSFTDGIHLTAEASRIVAKHILMVIKHADWEPSLFFSSMPVEFAHDSPYYILAADGKTTLNESHLSIQEAKGWE